MSPSARCAVLALLTLAGALVRTDHLGRCLWFDEAFTWRSIALPWREMARAVMHDSHPLLSFALYKLWGAAFGHSPIALRALSLVLSTATIPATYLCAGQAFGRDPRGPAIGLLAAALVAFSPYQIFWTTQIRMYGPATLLAVLSSWALLRAADRTDAAPGAWALWGLLTLALVHTHYYGLFVLGAQGLYLTLTLRGPRLRGAAVGALLLTLGLVPWAPVFLRQRAQIGASWWLKAPPSLPYALKLWYRIVFQPPLAPGEHPWLALLLAVLALCALAALARGRGAGRYLALAALIPWLGGTFVSYFGPTIIYTRYLLLIQPFLWVAAAALVMRLGARARAIAGVGLCLHASWLVAYQHLRLYVPEKPDIAAAVRALGPEPVVLHPMQYFAALAYAKDASRLAVYAPDGRLATYLGAQLIQTPERVVSDADLRALAPGPVAVVDSDAEDQGIAVPAHWRSQGQERFPVVWPEGSAIRVTRYLVPP